MDTDANPTKEKIPPEVLLDTAAFPSALQVFASEGGLALLAEHLPLLYPEVTRQVTPPEVSREQGGSGSIGHDWVTVESGEDVYEVSDQEYLNKFLKSDNSKNLHKLRKDFTVHFETVYSLFN